jgi:hypothetical protein
MSEEVNGLAHWQAEIRILMIHHSIGTSLATIDDGHHLIVSYSFFHLQKVNNYYSSREIPSIQVDKVSYYPRDSALIILLKSLAASQVLFVLHIVT